MLIIVKVFGAIHACEAQSIHPKGTRNLKKKTNKETMKQKFNNSEEEKRIMLIIIYKKKLKCKKIKEERHKIFLEK
jgi:hypothetical protein